MFNSGILASTVINDIIAEEDISQDIGILYYLRWLNSAEQLIYTDIIKEQSALTYTNATSGLIIDGFSFEDIYKVYIENEDSKKIELEKSSVAASCFMERDFIYWLEDNKISFKHNLYIKNAKIIVIYFKRPVLKTLKNYESLPISLPYEFLDLIYAKIRGEKFKLSNVDDLSAKWLNDYNNILEDFKTWIISRKEKYSN